MEFFGHNFGTRNAMESRLRALVPDVRNIHDHPLLKRSKILSLPPHTKLDTIKHFAMALGEIGDCR